MLKIVDEYIRLKALNLFGRGILLDNKIFIVGIIILKRNLILHINY